MKHVPFSSFSFGDYSLKNREDVPEGGEGGVPPRYHPGVGLKVEEGQMLTHKQLQMLEAIAEEKGNSTNPLCKEEQDRIRSLCMGCPETKVPDDDDDAADDDGTFKS